MGFLRQFFLDLWRRGSWLEAEGLVLGSKPLVSDLLVVFFAADEDGPAANLFGRRRFPDASSGWM